MKIVDTSNLSPVTTPSTKGAAGPESTKGRDAGRAATTGDGRDSADLSGLAGKISQAISKDSANRAAQVEQLRVQVANGTYQADAAATSRGIVSDALANAAGAGGSAKK
jgi:anti-sigma28 factor (negative regulator of flagellin synthesis)